MQITEWGKALEPRDDSTPAPTGTQVLVRIEACGVCHSDIHIQDGYSDYGNGVKVTYAKMGFPLPHTLGHEIVGEVVALGPDAKGAKLGDHRVIFPWIGCGVCEFCERGEELLCYNAQALGVRAPGGFSDYVMVPHPRYLIDYEGIPAELACTYACSGLTAYSALKKLAFVPADEFVVIIGIGGVGLSAVGLARSVLKAKVIAADIDPRKREAALAAGAVAAVDNSDPKAATAQLKALTPGGFGATGAIDFVGASATAQFGVNALRRGGTLVMVGLAGGEVPFPLLTFFQRMLTVRGSYVGSLEEMHELIALVKAGKVPPIPVAAKKLDQVNEVLDDMRAGKILGRVVVKPTA